MGVVLLKVVLAALPLLATLNQVLHGALLGEFIDRVPRIEDEAHLRQLRELVRRQMRAALLQIALLTTPIVVYVAAFATGVLRPVDSLYVLLPGIVVLGAGLTFRGVERRVRRLPAATPELERERDHVVAVWTSRLRPDW